MLSSFQKSVPKCPRQNRNLVVSLMSIRGRKIGQFFGPSNKRNPREKLPKTLPQFFPNIFVFNGVFLLRYQRHLASLRSIFQYSSRFWHCPFWTSPQCFYGFQEEWQECCCRRHLKAPRVFEGLGKNIAVFVKKKPHVFFCA